MQRLFTTLCLVITTVAAVRASAQTNPYKDGTPGVTGYRSEVMAEVIVQEDKFTPSGGSDTRRQIHVAPGRRRALIRGGVHARQRGKLQPV